MQIEVGDLVDLADDSQNTFGSSLWDRWKPKCPAKVEEVRLLTEGSHLRLVKVTGLLNAGGDLFEFYQHELKLVSPGNDVVAVIE